MVDDVLCLQSLVYLLCNHIICFMFAEMQHIRPPKSVASTWHIMPLTTGLTSHPMPIGAVGSSTEAYLAVKYYSV
ncbi:hypothetical protein F2Q70_00017098 [Brassica cretica]|uniref:Uncharacterized protein n=1 Tax=Brassica cretica TaxID=69181 RepID=A0A8S9QFI2_BRACR|nr:hypothetical protein F2Q70_00017098 [Brassica cretica]KAF2599046.1 hypothetical protein F2Q68_00010049 [Brassica cretica]KAF3541037.1 hypothetical protein F2Q69_00021996 [Brassica cretica]